MLFVDVVLHHFEVRVLLLGQFPRPEFVLARGWGTLESECRSLPEKERVVVGVITVADAESG
jgi:hypothetical protein